MHGKAFHGKAYMAMVTAAAAMALASGRTAMAQFRAGNDGHAMDNNPQAGSGTYNTPHNVNPAATGANLNYTYGNTAGLTGFQGNGALPDPEAFQGNIPQQQQEINNFNRIAAGSTVGPAPGAGPQLYYGATRFVAPPPGYTQFGSSGGYIAATPAYTNANDTRLGVVTFGPGDEASLTQNSLVPGGQISNFVNTNPVGQDFATSSPLYGAQQWSVNNFGTLATTGISSNGALLDDQQILQMRSELNSGNISTPQGFAPAVNNPNPPGNAPNGGQGGTSNLNSGPGSSTAQPPTISAGAQPLNNAVVNSGLSASRVPSAIPLTPLGAPAGATDESLRQQLLATPAQQSTQYAELQRRLAAYDATHTVTDEQAHEQFLQQQQTLQNAARNAPPGAAVTGAAPNPAGVAPGAPGAAAGASGGIPQPGAALPNGAPNASVPQPDNGQPMQVNSFSEGVGAAGLHDILATAESLMKQGRFNSAVDEYNTAAVIAPNNPMIVLGRANAELGAGNYTRAEIDLRQAFTSDQSLMMAQYNIESLIGKDRLAQVSSDLKQNATDSPNDETPEFLLAYIEYNTHDSKAAADHLHLAQQREGGQDALLASLRQHWNLPNVPVTTQPAGDMNR